MSAEQGYRCEVCNKYFKAITNSHLLRKHGMTTTQYKEAYPDSLMGNFDRFTDWRESDENRANLRRMTEKVFSTDSVRNKRAQRARKATQTEAYRAEQSERMKKIAAERPESYSGHPPSDWMKLSNYQRWEIEFGTEEADKRLVIWKSKNKLPSSSRNTKCEVKFANILRELGIDFQQQFSVSKFYCDFFLPDHNLVIEIDGDYWHANPARYKPDDLIGGKKMLASEIWERDAQREESIKESGYQVLRYWSSELKNKSHENILEDIVHASKKLLD